MLVQLINLMNLFFVKNWYGENYISYEGAADMGTIQTSHLHIK